MLESIWFFLWGILWAVYFILDGYDLGLGSLMPFLAESDRDKRIIYNAQGPFWDGNEVWLITAGGVTFAAFPRAYAVMFSGLYTALMLLLFALILRGVSFEFRNKVDSDGWRKVWDACLVLGSFLPALLFGVAFANIFQGLPLDADGVFQGGLLTLLNPYGLAGGVLFVLMFAVHGSLWLTIKSEGPIQERAARMANRLWPVLLGWVVLFLILTFTMTQLFTNYLVYPVLFALLLVPVAGLLGIKLMLARKNWWGAWGASAVAILGVTLFGVTGLYPNLLPSSLNPAWSVSISNAASSPLTLKIMLGVALTFVPIVLAYQFWAHKTFGHALTDEHLDYDEAY